MCSILSKYCDYWDSILVLILLDQRGELDEIIPTNAAPTPRSFHTAVLIEEDMYIFGGVNQDGVYLNDLYIFNLG